MGSSIRNRLPFAARSAWKLAPVLVVWVIMEAVIDPRGNFPLNDDWLFGTLVQRMLAGDSFQPGGIPNMTLFTHIAWGALACYPFGCDDEMLRFFTILWGFAGLISIYYFIRAVQASGGLALVCTMLVAFNPLYISMANTYMTDVPFTVMFVLSATWFIQNIKGQSGYFIVAGTLMACVATLSRQIALAVPLSFSLCALAITISRPGRPKLRTFLCALLPFIVCVAVFVVFELWLAHSNRLPRGQADATAMLVGAALNPMWSLRQVAGQTFVAAAYYGWFLTPLLLIIPWWTFREGDPKWRKALPPAAAIIVGALALVSVVQTGHMMPIHMNVIIPQGIGPLTLHDAYPYGNGVLKLTPIPPLPATVWFPITVCAVFGAAGLAAAFVPAAMLPFRALIFGLAANDWVVVFLILTACLYLFPTFLIFWFDRYLLPPLPFLLAILCAGKSIVRPISVRARSAFVAAGLVLVGTGLFAALGTADYLAWNRARWAALDVALKIPNITSKHIDGGIEFNGRYNAAEEAPHAADKSWWWVWDDDVVVAFAPFPGYRVIQEFRFSSWLHPDYNRIVLLRRNPRKP